MWTGTNTFLILPKREDQKEKNKEKFHVGPPKPNILAPIKKSDDPNSTTHKTPCPFSLSLSLSLSQRMLFNIYIYIYIHISKLSVQSPSPKEKTESHLFFLF
jgi:hypothetical protein